MRKKWVLRAAILMVAFVGGTVFSHQQLYHLAQSISIYGGPNIGLSSNAILVGSLIGGTIAAVAAAIVSAIVIFIGRRFCFLAQMPTADKKSRASEF